MTKREALDRWLAATEWAEIGGDGGDAMRCRPLGDEGRESAPWIRGLGSPRTRILEAEAATVDVDAVINGATVAPATAARERCPGAEPSCPVHGPSLAGICWRCTERLGSRFTGIATLDPDTGLLAFVGANPPAEPAP